MVIGILAHVDGGKTTLSESILYHTNVTRRMGRVDHGDAFLDTDQLERKRGITIYSKEAVFELDGRKVYLLDTPGHVDFSAEMERTLQVLDYAVLVINGSEGVQSHTTTLWRLFRVYNIPVFIFVNKMDQPNTDKKRLLKEIREKLAEEVIDMQLFESEPDNADILESIAMTSEELLDYFMENGTLTHKHIVDSILQRRIFPCYFGSALRDEGVEEFLNGFSKYTMEKEYGTTFYGRVFKIARDQNGNRLTYLKVLGGSLKVKSVVRGGNEEEWEEKAEQLRVYSGEKYQSVDEAKAGMVCAVVGLTKSRAGELVGDTSFTECDELKNPVLEPVLMYRLILPDNVEPRIMLNHLRQLEEEEPQLNVVWNEYLSEISVRVMGKVQIEILKSVIKERYNIDVEFGTGNIVYKETIANTVEGVGHFEPLRHYAEVHIVMEPLPQGSGIVIESKCSEDVLSKNWQRLIMTHLREKEHKGVLTGSSVTDIKFTLTSGRAHLKHTEGGDFRQATYRAVRQGLMEAESVLLEPNYNFRLEIPGVNLGRAMTDIERMYGSFAEPKNEGDMVVLTGRCPVAQMAEYPAEVIAYTKGRGHIAMELGGYWPCHNSEEIVDKISYNPDNDELNPTGSVFCAHGAGFYVSWNEVKNHMHMDATLYDEDEKLRDKAKQYQMENIDTSSKDYFVSEEEIKKIIGGTYRKGSDYETKNSYKKKTVYNQPKTSNGEYYAKDNEEKEEYLLVDGYNIIFAWDELNELSKDNLEASRAQLMELLCNYQGYKKCNLIVVFDAYKVEGNKGSVEKYKNIYVVYTKEAETADQYIEKTVHKMKGKYNVTVATSDRLEQMIIMGDGALRISAKGFLEEVKRTEADIRNYLTN